MSQFNWNDLRYFLAVARAGTLTGAAQNLRTDHTTVSRRIGALEQSLQVRLFDRRPAGYRLTPHGETLLRSAEAMESAAFAAQTGLGDEGQSISGAVRIGAPDGIGSYFLAPRIGGLCRTYPNLEVQLVAMPRIFSLSKREADLAISLSRPTEGRLFARKLTDYSLRLYASAQYLADHGPIIRREHIARHMLIGYIDNLIYAPELDYVGVIGAAAPRLTSTNLVAQLHATLAGAGLCVLPRFMADDFPTLTPVLPGEIEITRSFWLVVHEDLRSMARISVTSEFIAETMRAAHDRFMPPP